MTVDEVIEMLGQYDGKREMVFSDYTQVVVPDESGEKAKEQYILLRDDEVTHIVEDEILVEFTTTARVNLSELNIYPEGMSDTQIKKLLIKALHEMIDDNCSIEIFGYDVKLHKETATIRSVPMIADEETNN